MDLFPMEKMHPGPIFFPLPREEEEEENVDDKNTGASRGRDESDDDEDACKREAAVRLGDEDPAGPLLPATPPTSPLPGRAFSSDVISR